MSFDTIFLFDQTDDRMLTAKIHSNPKNSQPEWPIEHLTYKTAGPGRVTKGQRQKAVDPARSGVILLKMSRKMSISSAA
jgi:hypothetical protein